MQGLHMTSVQIFYNLHTVCDCVSNVYPAVVIGSGYVTGKQPKQAFLHPDNHSVFVMTNVKMCHHIYNSAFHFDLTPQKDFLLT